MKYAMIACVALGAAAVAGAAEVFPKARLSVVQDVDGYNSWPMIQASGGRLVCAYGRGKGHSVEGSRGAYARTSSDGGRTWTPEVCIVNDPVICEGVEGSGRDAGGAMLFWMNCRGRGHIRHEVYRTVDGISFEKIAAPELSPEPIQVTGIFSVPGVGLMSLWFAGNYRSAEPCNSWGTLVSADGGRTWTQRTVEKELAKKDWPTEICAVELGGGRILAIGRSEGDVKRQFQLTSTDGGVTWRKAGTNIRDVRESTPALIFDRDAGVVSHYYYQRGPGILWRRTVSADYIFGRPESWPAPVEVARGGRNRPYDSGNVTAVAMGESHYLAYYSGDPTNTAVLVACVPARPSAAKTPGQSSALVLPSGRLVTRGMLEGVCGTTSAYPDSTVAAFRHALGDGFGCTCAVWLTTDGEVFCAKERSLKSSLRIDRDATDVAWKGCLDRIDVGELWGSHLAKREGMKSVSRFGDFLACVPSGRRVTVEVSDPRSAIVAALRKAWDSNGRLHEEDVRFVATGATRTALEAAFPKAKFLDADDSPVIDDVGEAVAAFERGARRIRTNDPAKLWNGMVPLVSALNGDPIDIEAVRRSYWTSSGYANRSESREPIMPRVCGEFPGLGFHGRAATLDPVIPTNAVGDESRKSWRGKAWRNERVHAQFVVWTGEARPQLRCEAPSLKGPGGRAIGAENVSVRFVKYVLAETTKRTVMRRELPPFIAGDILDDAEEVDLPPGGFRPVWLTVKVPADAEPGVYRGTLRLTAGLAADAVEFPVEVEVVGDALPDKPKFFLDYWQRPGHVAAYHRVKPWSPAHFALMEPLYRELAAAGQKVIWTLAIDDLWHRSESGVRDRTMVRRVKNADGTWSFDFSVLDRYVDFCRKCGIGPQIHCYSMLRFQTWGASSAVHNHTLDHTDGATGRDVQDFFPDYDAPEFEEYWAPFLKAIDAHVREKGWQGDFFMAADEMDAKIIGRFTSLIRRHAPAVKFAMASDRPVTAFKDLGIANYSEALRGGGRITEELYGWAKERRLRGETTTFYTCNFPAHPNNWVTSPLAEQEWMGLYAAAAGFDGMLRWAACSWEAEPFWDISVSIFEPGETHFIYPNGLVSPRWEVLRDSIENFEKIRILRETGRETPALAKALKGIDYIGDLQNDPSLYRSRVDAVLAAIDEAQRTAAR